MPTILIGGYYGAGNIGDEAILVAMISELRAQRSDLSFIVTSWEPEKTNNDLNVQTIYWKDINALLDAVLCADMIILGGGGIFHDYWGIDPDTYLRKGFWDITAFGSLPLLAKLLDIPCMIYAVGVGPFQSDIARQHTRIAFERCQIATLRDSESLEILKQTGFDINDPSAPIVKVLSDPVFSLTTSFTDDADVADFLRQRQIEAGTPLLGISLRYWDLEGPPEEWLPFVANGVREFLKKNSQIQVILIPFQVLNATPHTNDAIVLKKLADLIDISEQINLIEGPLTPQFAQALIKRCSTIVGMRLHSVIMGINVGTPVVALSYAPKVWSIMERVGLEDFCNASFTPKADDLAAQIEDAWNQRDEFRLRIRPLWEELKAETKEHARLALDLLSRSHRSELQFPQQFALQQIRLLLQTDEKLLTLDLEQQEKDRRILSLSTQLAVFASPNFQKLTRFYYHVVKETPFKYLYRFIISLNHAGLREIVRDEGSTKVINNVVSILNDRSLKGIFVVTSAFVFSDHFNQRVINLSKFLSVKGWGVVYVAWRSSEAEEMPSIGKEVYKNIFQVPMDMFLKNTYAFAQIKFPKKFFLVEFPYPDFLPSGLELRRNNFKFVYEIIDEWEEFHKVGQAAWFNKALENAFVTNANFVTATAPSLIKKFSNLRHDIHLSPNGYTPALLGVQHRNIAHNKQMGKDEFHLGYFGHLTEAWFDWDFLLNVLDLAYRKNFNLHVHLIGDGEPNLQKKLAGNSDRVEYYGKIPPSELYKYVKKWDAAMIWFKPGKLSEAVDPIKIYEYLYFGLPVIVKGIDRLGEFPSTHVVMNENQALDALIALQDNRLKHTDASQKINPATEQVLAKSTWEQRFTGLLEIMENEKWISL